MIRVFGFTAAIILVTTIAIVAQQRTPPKSAPGAAAQAGGQAPQPKAEPKSAPADPLRQMLKSYGEAFNKNDAKAVAAFWTAEGVHHDRDSGERTSGRDALAADFQKLFKDHPGTKISAELISTRLVKVDIASIQGVANLVTPGQPPATTNFSAILVKEGDKWLLDTVEESSPATPESASDALAEFEWMIGHWVDQSPSGRVDTTVRWGAGNSFLVRSFVSENDDGETQQGTQVIGWDANLKQYRSWSFYSDGSFGEGLWSKNGGEWLIKSTQTLDDGSLASGTQILKRIDNDTVTVQTIGREIDGVPTPSDDPITVVRAPKEEKATSGDAAKR